ncbi:MAG: protein kinase domain-containing protein [Isosphaeraceae bacterium]
MNETKIGPNSVDDAPGLATTARDGAGDDGRTVPASPAAPPGLAETGEFTAGPRTEVDSVDGRATHGDSAELGFSVDPTARPDDDRTGALDPGNPTVDATGNGMAESQGTIDPDATTAREVGPTADFVLGPDAGLLAAANTERIVPPTGRNRAEEIPRIAGFEILSVLGAGGMGIVYKARQTRLDRYVALKMIRAGAGARPGDLRRFDAEARAVAAIDHPNIIRIFDIGEHDGLPFFSLEYVEGGSLARRIEGKPQPVDESARITEILARALDVAHRRGIIHRDIKPANILLGADDTPKIADFGLVKRLEADSSQTRTGSILGSPSYMSPEQATGAEKVGPEADQYALGATLYEMLTGRPPFRGTSVIDTLDLVRNREPVPPSQLLPRMPRDLETICLKCLEKDPARRYPDVAALADDLGRFRRGEPIVARPISAAERLWRWCLRNKGVAALAAAVGLLVVVVAVGATAGLAIVAAQKEALGVANNNLKRSNTDLTLAKAEAEKRQHEAEAEHRRAVAAGQAAIKQNRDVVSAQRDMIQLLEHTKFRYLPGIQDLREQALNLAARALESAVESMSSLRDEIGWPTADEQLNWRTVASAYQRLAELSLSRNQLPEAIRRFRQMDEIITRLAKSAPDDLGTQIRLARSRRNLGYIAMNRVGDGAEARRYFDGSLEMIRAGLVKQPDDDGLKYELANGLGQLASAEMRLGHLDRARKLYDEEMSVRRSFAASYAVPRQVELDRELSGLYERLGELALRMVRKDECRKYYEQCAEIRERLYQQRPDFWPFMLDRALSYNNAGYLLYPAGKDPAGARALHHKAAELLARRVAVDPNDAMPRATLATTLYYEATCALHSGDPAAAAEGYRRCLQIREKLATDPDEKIPMVNLIVAVARCGQHTRAASIAARLMKSPPRDEHIYFQIACGYALAADAARAERWRLGATLGSPLALTAAGLDDALARLYTDLAVDALRRGKRLGWTDVVSLETDPDLEPIRNDPAFRALVAEFSRPGAASP